MVTAPLKQCMQCDREFPATGEYFRRDKNAPGGIRSICRECTRKNKKRWYDQNRGDQNAKQRAQYARDPQRKLATNRRYFEAHPEVKPESDRRYYREHADQIKHRVKTYKSLNPHVARKSRLKRYAENPAITLARNERRRANKRGLPNDFTAADWHYALEYFGHACAVCGRKADFWTVIAPDHWVALSDPRPDNPGTVRWNIVPLCHAKAGVPAGEPCCNNSKHKRDAWEWLVERFGQAQAQKIWGRVSTYFERVMEVLN
jgi:hypothetical protein